MEEDLGTLIDNYHTLRAERISIEKSIEDLKKQENIAKDILLEKLEEMKLTKAAGNLASVSISETVVPTVEDWDAFYSYVHRKKAYHLLERRPAAAPYREELSLRGNKDIPGVKPFTKKNINMSKLSK